MKAITDSEFIYLLIAILTSSVKSCGEIEYCGGGHGDFEEEISCTCYPAKNKDLPPYTWQDYCDADVLEALAKVQKLGSLQELITIGFFMVVMVQG